MLKKMESNNWARWLILSCGNGLCAVPFICVSTPQVQPNATQTAQYLVRGHVSGRVGLTRLTEPLKVDEENEIPILLHGYNVQATYVSLRYFDPSGSLLSPDTDTEATVMYH
jgi:hypothetical protein